MARWLAYLSVVTVAVGCSGQGNPFMRTTVPPPGTGAGAPSDPYYNNSGGPQPPPVAVPQTSPMPGPTSTAPVVPAPDKRFSQPGGYNFPQGSVNHRKAVDPAPRDYQAGTSAIARAARPRNLVTQSSSGTAVTAHDESSSAEDELVATGSISEERLSETTDDADHSGGQSAPSNTTLAGETDSQTPVTKMAIESVGEGMAANGSASARIITLEPADDPPSNESQNTSLSATESPSPTTAAGNRVLFAAAPTPSATDTQLALTAVGLAANSKASSSPRFYFDRNQPKQTADAQRATYTAPANEGVVPANGDKSTGITSGPDGAPPYSNHNSYAWLRGRLEYSTAARRWKLRYIPIDGMTDQYGGSVVLPNSPQLEQFHPGDMVTVLGVVGNGPAEHGSFSPLYELRTIKSQH